MLPLVLASCQALLGACKQESWNILIYLATGQSSSLDCGVRILMGVLRRLS